jgi:hypothetical protein
MRSQFLSQQHKRLSAKLVYQFGEGQKAFYRDIPPFLFTGYDGYYSLRHLNAVPTILITPDSARYVSKALKIIVRHSIANLPSKAEAMKCSLVLRVLMIAGFTIYGI